MTRLRIHLPMGLVTCLLLMPIHTCTAQFGLAVSSASAGGAVASAGGVTAVARLPQLGFGFNNWPLQQRSGYNAQQQPGDGFNRFSSNNNNRGMARHRHGIGKHRHGLGRPQPVQMGWDHRGGDHGAWNPWGASTRNPSGWGGYGGWGYGAPRPPPGWGVGTGLGNRPAWANGNGWNNRNGQPPNKWNNAEEMPRPGWIDDNSHLTPDMVHDGLTNGAAMPSSPTAINPASEDTLIIGSNKPPLVAPTPPPDQSNALIMGTSRPPLVPPLMQPTPAPTATIRSIELSEQRNIVFPSVEQVLSSPNQAEPIDIRRR